MKPQIVYAARVWPRQSERGWAFQRDDHNEPSYIADTCAGGATSHWFADARTWDTEAELVAELAAAELEGEFEIVKIIRCQAG